MTTACTEPNRYVVALLLPDRVAILRDVSSAVNGIRGNIDAISQTVVAGYFTVILTASFPSDTGEDDIRGAIQAHFTDEHLNVVVDRYAVPQPACARPRGDRYMVTAHGPDRGGILMRITSFLAARHINIEDWYVALDGGHVTHIGEVSLPPSLDVKQVQDEFRGELASAGLSGSMQHVNIFRATNEVGPIRALLNTGHPGEQAQPR
jgi:glycine cleavage system transcriptional repressor